MIASAPSRLLTPDDAAQRLALEVPELLKLRAAGAIAGVNVALPGAARPRWRFEAAEIERFVAGRRSLPSPKQPRRKRQAAAAEVEFY